MADAAYWVDGATGDVVSSTYYQNVLPDWVQQFNAAKPAQMARDQRFCRLNCAVARSLKMSLYSV
jgi:hypothetical protein